MWQWNALALTRVLAVEPAGHNISVNGVGPGSVVAPTSESYLAEAAIARYELERTPAGRLGKPKDIAEAVAFRLLIELVHRTGSLRARWLHVGWTPVSGRASTCRGGLRREGNRGPSDCRR